MGKKILLADDSITIQKVISITFSSPEYEITIVDNGNDAIKKALEVKPDIILTDIVMPGKNGYEVCDAIKSNPILQSTPVLLLTGAFEAFDEQRAKQVGADAWLSKPFETQALIDKVNTLLSKPAVKKPAEAKAVTAKPTVKPPPPPKPAAPPLSGKPGTPPPPPPRKPSVAPPTPLNQQPAPPPIEATAEKNEPELVELSETESFEITEDTVGEESGWETVPLTEEKPQEASPIESSKEEMPLEGLSEPSLTEETGTQELLSKEPEEGAVGFEDLEAAIEEAEKPQESAPVEEQYEKTYEVQELEKHVEPESSIASEEAPRISLSREELIEQASAQIENLLKELLPDIVKQVVESKADAIIKDVAEKVIWEVVPALTETMIKEEIQRLKTAKKKA